MNHRSRVEPPQHPHCDAPHHNFRWGASDLVKVVCSLGKSKANLYYL